MSKQTAQAAQRLPGESAVLTERAGQLLIITLNRPDARNSVNAALAEGVAAALDEFEANDDLAVAVLTGAGKGFSAGMDLKAFVRGERPFAGGRGFAGICTRPPAEKPLIAAIEGFAVAGGLEIALACDLLVAARGAKLGIPETKRGLIAGAGALIRLPRRLPHHVAMELALTGDPIDAERAWALGLVNEVCEPGEALTRAVQLAERIADNAPLAVRASKRLALVTREMPESEAWKWQDQLGESVFASEDAREGAISFAERRAPQWKGR